MKKFLISLLSLVVLVFPSLIKNHEIEPMIVIPGSLIKIKFEKKPKGDDTLGVTRWINNIDTEKVSLRNNLFIVAEKKGVYIYDVYASWKKGSASYVFAVEVK